MPGPRDTALDLNDPAAVHPGRRPRLCDRRSRLGPHQFAIVEAGHVVGSIGLHLDNHKTGHPGYWCAAEARGRGITTRALRRLCRYALDELGLERLALTADVENIASQRVAEKVGFRREGVLRSHKRRPDGRRRDTALYSLLPGELPATAEAATRPPCGEGMSFNVEWEQEAENWIVWARTPGHDAYWRYRDAFFELLPLPGRATLEIGCGEGRVARDLAARGHRVTGVDASPTLLRAAREAHPDGHYLLADAAALGFEEASFDLVVAYNSLMDMQDMPGAVREAARVLERGGRFCACVTHPLADAGRFAARETDAPFVIEGSYFGRRRFEGTFGRKGLQMTFRGWAYPLEAYGRALEEAGMLIEALREPPVPAAAVERDPAERRWQRLPCFLMLRALTPATGAEQ